MTLEKKKALLADVNSAVAALGRIGDDGPHDFSQLSARSQQIGKQLHKEYLTALAGLSILAAQLESEIGTDNL